MTVNTQQPLPLLEPQQVQVSTVWTNILIHFVKLRLDLHILHLPPPPSHPSILTPDSDLSSPSGSHLIFSRNLHTLWIEFDPSYLYFYSFWRDLSMLYIYIYIKKGSWLRQPSHQKGIDYTRKTKDSSLRRSFSPLSLLSTSSSSCLDSSPPHSPFFLVLPPTGVHMATRSWSASEIWGDLKTPPQSLFCTCWGFLTTQTIWIKLPDTINHHTFFFFNDSLPHSPDQRCHPAVTGLRLWLHNHCTCCTHGWKWVVKVRLMEEVNFFVL